MNAQPLPQAADADSLTDALRRAGVLGLSRSSFPTAMSRVVRLRLAYEPAPGSVIFKTAGPDLGCRELLA